MAGPRKPRVGTLATRHAAPRRKAPTMLTVRSTVTMLLGAACAVSAVALAQDAKPERKKGTIVDGTVNVYDYNPKESGTDPDIAGQTAKSSLFRINRDVRFSRNKAPYKTNFGAYLARGGRKSTGAGYYFHLEPGASLVGGGVWMPAPPDLARIRQEIDYCLDEFRGIIESAEFVRQYGGLSDGPDMRLQRIPKGYEADNPAAPYLRYKSVVAMKPLSDELLLSDKALKESIDACKALSPLLKFLNRALSE